MDPALRIGGDCETVVFLDPDCPFVANFVMFDHAFAPTSNEAIEDK